MRPLLLDLFCGAGGAAMGYARAGFDVVGVDVRPCPRYPFAFVLADAFTFPLDGFDAIHASPPCQRHSKTRAILHGKGLECRGTDDGIERIRERLIAHGSPYVIENVPGAPLRDPILLCGTMFGLGVLRHRLFESNRLLRAPEHPRHEGSTNSHRGYSRGARYVTVGGHNYNPEDGRRAMGIDWMRTRDGELNEAIPPAYTEWVGRQLMETIRCRSH